MIPQTAAPPPGIGGVQREMYCSSGFANRSPGFCATRSVSLHQDPSNTRGRRASLGHSPPGGLPMTMAYGLQEEQ